MIFLSKELINSVILFVNTIFRNFHIKFDFHNTFQILAHVINAE